MEILARLSLILVLTTLMGCGVKGRPLPPLNPAPIGFGEPRAQGPGAAKPNKKTPPLTEGQQ